MSVVLNYLILCGIKFGVVTSLYVGLKTIKIIKLFLVFNN
jgi:hypothetical protein